MSSKKAAVSGKEIFDKPCKIHQSNVTESIIKLINFIKSSVTLAKFTSQMAQDQ